jgi:hypothetical protein
LQTTEQIEAALIAVEDQKWAHWNDAHWNHPRRPLGDAECRAYNDEIARLTRLLHRAERKR